MPCVATQIELIAKSRHGACNDGVTKGGLILSGLAALALLLGALRGEGDDLSHDEIVTVLEKDGTYLASTTDGFYRASESDHVWHKVTMPAGMWPGGRLARNNGASRELAYYTCAQGEDYIFGPSKAGGLWLSIDGGATWRATSLKRSVLAAFLHPDGALYVITNDHPSSSFEPREHLLVSNDHGEAWKDITPPVPDGYGMGIIKVDPANPHLVFIRAFAPFAAWQKFYQATDATYAWAEIPWAKLPKNLPTDYDPFAQPMSGTANSFSDMPANLENFFKFPFPRNGNRPELPTYFLKAEKTAYQFHLHQPMPVKVSSFFLNPEAPVKITDHPDPQIFWGLKVQAKDGAVTWANPKTAELNIAYPDHEAKLAAYSNDPRNSSVEADQQHPYERTIDLRNLYDFKQPGTYRVALFINSIYMDRKTGSSLGTVGIDLTIAP